MNYEFEIDIAEKSVVSIFLRWSNGPFLSLQEWRDIVSLLLICRRKNMQLILYTADCVGNAKNCNYPRKAVVTSADELQDAVSTDHVCAQYQGNYRSVDNFISSNVVVMDCDNDHFEDPSEWITPEKL